MEILKKHLKNISSDREIALKAVAKAIYQDVKSSGKAQVIFICTHNSRRSQLAELMLSHLLRLNNISHIYCYSGGTEATAFNHRMVKAVIDFGIPLLKYGPDSNPLYIANDTQYLFSKKSINYAHLSERQPLLCLQL